MRRQRRCLANHSRHPLEHRGEADPTATQTRIFDDRSPLHCIRALAWRRADGCSLQGCAVADDFRILRNSEQPWRHRYDKGGMDKTQTRAELTKEIRTARRYLVGVGILMFVVDMVLLMAQADQMTTYGRNLIVAIDVLILGLFFALAYFVPRAPRFCLGAGLRCSG